MRESGVVMRSTIRFRVAMAAAIAGLAVNGCAVPQADVGRSSSSVTTPPMATSPGSAGSTEESQHPTGASSSSETVETGRSLPDALLAAPTPIGADTELSGDWRLGPPPQGFDLSSVDIQALQTRMLQSDSRLPRWLAQAKVVSWQIGELRTTNQPTGAGVFLYLRLADGPVCVGTYAPTEALSSHALVEQRSSPCAIGLLQSVSDPTLAYTFEGVP
jgi:hypothetical protein